MQSLKSFTRASGAALGLAIIVSISLAGCGNGGSGGTSAAPKSAPLPAGMSPETVEMAHKAAVAQQGTAPTQPAASEDVK